MKKFMPQPNIILKKHYGPDTKTIQTSDTPCPYNNISVVPWATY